MKTLKSIIVVLLLTATFTFGQTNWEIDKSHSKIGFSVSHLIISEVDGSFSEFDGSIVSTGDDFENAKVEFSANTASINTDNEKRDNHLKADDFFSAEKFPKITFVSKSFKKVDSKNYKLVGDFTIKDVTKEIVLNVVHNGTIKDPWGKTRAGFTLTGEINRFDYNLTWSKALETGGLVVGEDVAIIGKFEVTKK